MIKKGQSLEPVAKLLLMDKTMILSQFAIPSPSTYSNRVGLGNGMPKWLKRAFLP